MIILGVDPGTLVTGYGVIEATGRGSAMKVIEYGTIESRRISSLPLRLETIFKRLEAVIARTMPDEFAIESAFYDKNVQSTLKLGHARGVAILAAVLKQIPTSEYAPREVKRSVVGNGNASKDQVEYMVRMMLKLPANDIKLPDAYDALAVAITHATRGATGSAKSAKNWKQFIEDNPDRVSSGGKVVLSVGKRDLVQLAKSTAGARSKKATGAASTEAVAKAISTKTVLTKKALSKAALKKSLAKAVPGRVTARTSKTS